MDRDLLLFCVRPCIIITENRYGEEDHRIPERRRTIMETDSRLTPIGVILQLTDYF